VNVGEGGDEGMKGMKVFPTLVMICMLCYVVACACVRAEIQPKTVSEAETLEVYGNANGDDTIDMRDVTYIKLVIFGKKPETEFCDANHDGRVSMLDVVQTKLIIVGKEGELTFVDARGESVTVRLPLKRIVVLNPDACEAIRALGSKERVVGVTSRMKDCPRFYPELSERVSVGSSFSPDIEQIIALNPDAVFAYSQWPSTEKLEDKLPADMKVIRLDFYIARKVKGEINILGYLLGAQDKASEYIEWHDRYVNEIIERVSEIPDDERTTVFTEGGGGKEFGRRAYANGTGLFDLSVMAGGKNIAAELEGYTDVETEWILTQRPEVIVSLVYGCGYETDNKSEMEERYNKIIELPGFKEEVPAVINNRVHIIDNDFFGPSYVYGLAYMAKWLYPEIFSDFDPQAIHQEYINKFCGIDFDVSKQGAFVYP